MHRLLVRISATFDNWKSQGLSFWILKMNFQPFHLKIPNKHYKNHIKLISNFKTPFNSVKKTKKTNFPEP